MAVIVGSGSRSAYQVELIEDEVAQVVDLESGRAKNVKRTQLPRGAKEGDIVVNGRVDEALSAELRREIEALRKRYAVPMTPLTGGEE